MFSFFSAPDNNKLLIDDPAVSPSNKDSDSLLDSLPWDETGETPLQWAGYELRAKFEDLKDGVTKAIEKIQTDMSSSDGLEISQPNTRSFDHLEVSQPNTRYFDHLEVSQPTEENSALSSLLPWNTHDETPLEWADQELSTRFDINVPVVVAEARDTVVSLFSCSGPR